MKLWREKHTMIINSGLIILALVALLVIVISKEPMAYGRQPARN
jgi:hypothetical protein